MTFLALPMVMLGAVLAQGPHPQGVEHIVLDMNVEAVSLLGQKLYRTPAEGEALTSLEASLAEAEKNAAAKPDDPLTHVEHAKALGGMWRYHDAVQAYTKAVSLTPTDGELFARRANIFILIRQFDQAKIDFEQSTAIAPQVANGWIGLGIANYLRQKFEEAAKAFEKAGSLPMSGDERTVNGFWTNLTQRRLGKPGDPNAPMWDWMKDYVAGVDKFLAGDKAGALHAWHAMTDNLADWPILPHICAEADVAALEGSKKMKAVAF